jgi:hypothetical protein
MLCAGNRINLFCFVFVPSHVKVSMSKKCWNCPVVGTFHAKLMASQLVKKFLAFMEPKIKEKVHCHTLFGDCWIQFTPCFPEIHFNNIFLHMALFCQILFHCAFLNTFVCIYRFPHVSCPSYPPWFQYCINISWRDKLWSSSLCNFLHPLVTPFLAVNVTMSSSFQATSCVSHPF